MAIGSHGCYLGEDSDVVYTLTVCVPERKPHSWVPDAFSRLQLPDPNAGPFQPPRDPKNPAFYLTNDFKRKHLIGMKTKEIKISSWDLPVQCKHVRKSGSRGCSKLCYVLEEGGKSKDYWKCGRVDCQGHVYCDRVAHDAEHDSVCFGKKGKRMVCVDPSLNLKLYNDLIRRL